ncbi:MutS-related protein [Chitinophaga nivalis]|uniref:DNA mismatch repair protein n=1 Tax=Chitinophaga nivalis TaxID=2991709 RepID=A0ABT3INH5_9BACT|nr:DNA mismatch repair protein [Chitinophaga nivalis]MCW3464770.1 DNA mismatch repair protein [Chitinophaga nivalis]MCW3485539.1 DNA mismatch repair protein [Chitinophaga nivalis]
MYLQTDMQTMDDLRLFSKADTQGIYDIYNHSFTRGGQTIMEAMFRKPLNNREAILKRINTITAFVNRKASFPFDGAMLDQVEKYISFDDNPDGGTKVSLSEKEVQHGVMAIINLFHTLRQYLASAEMGTVKELEEERLAAIGILNAPAFIPVFNAQPNASISFAAVTAFDVLIRSKEKQQVLQLLHFIYHIDVYISVAQVTLKHNMIFPVVHPKGTSILKVDGVYHPLLKNAVANSLHMTPARNLIFLTGANMAGKSTFLRSFSTAVYIAHMGFPVAAAAMEFSVMDGVYTTINLPDNLGIGASHFYAEVLRVKKIGQELSEGKSLFVLFDELFRGTNVKDALEGTLAVCNAFTNRKDSKFIISSHIIEAADELRKKESAAFYFLPTVMKGTVPAYTYTLEEGVTNDKHGMIIINNEGILDILKQGNKGGKRLNKQL